MADLIAVAGALAGFAFLILFARALSGCGLADVIAWQSPRPAPLPGPGSHFPGEVLMAG